MRKMAIWAAFVACGSIGLAQGGGQAPAAGGGGRQGGEGRTVVLEQAPKDHSIAIPKDKLAQYFKDMADRRLNLNRNRRFRSETVQTGKRGRPGAEASIPGPEIHSRQQADRSLRARYRRDSGSGRAVAAMFAGEGADVAITALPAERRDADETRAAIAEQGRCLVLEGDRVHRRDLRCCNAAISRCSTTTTPS